MRDLKFRAWDFESMRYDVTGFEHGKENEMQGIFLDGDYYPISSNPVMQYTGLKDKNGKEIYEGDIVRILYTDWPSNPAPNNEELEEYKKYISNYGEVIFSNLSGNAEFELTNQDWRGLISPGKHGEIEVIGNIYENPGLLERED